MKEKVICGIQQIGIGVRNVAESWSWYREHFGFKVKVFEDEGVAELMLPYTGGKPQPRYAVLLLNMRGGCGFEVWEPRQRELNYPEKDPILGDTGIFACKVKCPDVTSAYRSFMRKGLNVLTEPVTSPWGQEHFFVRDPWGNLFDIEEDRYVFTNASHLIGGGNGVTIGVTDMERSIGFYGKLLDYDTVVSDTTGIFEDLEGIPGSEHTLRRVLLKRSKPIQGPLSELLGTSHLELIQSLSSMPSKIYEGRMWGDPGFIHLCFDVRNMDTIQKEAEALGHPFVCDSGTDFEMGDANGHFAYVEDPDGTLIEFVETFRIPVLKRLGLYIDLRDKDDKKPLSRFITKSLRLLSAKPKRNREQATGNPL